MDTLKMWALGLLLFITAPITIPLVFVFSIVVVAPYSLGWLVWHKVLDR